jgi:hypothetical protein
LRLSRSDAVIHILAALVFFLLALQGVLFYYHDNLYVYTCIAILGGVGAFIFWLFRASRIRDLDSLYSGRECTANELFPAEDFCNKIDKLYIYWHLGNPVAAAVLLLDARKYWLDLKYYSQEQILSSFASQRGNRSYERRDITLRFSMNIGFYIASAILTALLFLQIALIYFSFSFFI